MRALSAAEHGSVKATSEVGSLSGLCMSFHHQQLQKIVNCFSPTDADRKKKVQDALHESEAKRARIDTSSKKVKDVKEKERNIDNKDEERAFSPDNLTASLSTCKKDASDSKETTDTNISTLVEKPDDKSDYDFMVSEFHPIDDAAWQKGEP